MSKPRTDKRESITGKGLIFVISGPSGSGKTTLARKLVADPQLNNKFNRSISITTRPKRPGEKNGKDYFFYNREQFLQARKAKKILEWTRYLGYYYATPKDFARGVLRKNKNLVLALDLKGARHLKKVYPCNTVTIFILAPSLKALRDRIEKRSPGTIQQEVRGRIKLAADEISARGAFDYCLVNKDLEKTFSRLKKIVAGELKKAKIQLICEEGDYGLRAN